MLKQLYTVVGEEKSLPFYVVGLAVDCWQFPIKRTEGYEYSQLFINRKGEGKIIIGGQQYDIGQGDVFFIPAKIPHEYFAVSDEWYLDWICFNGTYVDTLMNQWELNQFKIFSTADSERMHRLINKMYCTLKSDKLYGNHYASAQLYDLLIEYRKVADSRISTSYNPNVPILANVLQYIEENYSNVIKLENLSDVAGVTQQHLCRLFKKHFQMRPMEYISKVRVMHAKELLDYTDKTITQISNETGFQDSSYFSVVFKRYENVTPGEYRKIRR